MGGWYGHDVLLSAVLERGMGEGGVFLPLHMICTCRIYNINDISFDGVFCPCEYFEDLI